MARRGSKALVRKNASSSMAVMVSNPNSLACPRTALSYSSVMDVSSRMGRPDFLTV